MFDFPVSNKVCPRTEPMTVCPVSNKVFPAMSECPAHPPPPLHLRRFAFGGGEFNPLSELQASNESIW